MARPSRADACVHGCVDVLDGRLYTAAWTLQADACVHGRVDISGGCVCTRLHGRYRRAQVYTTFSDVHACDGCMDVSGVRACTRVLERFRMYMHVMVGWRFRTYARVHDYENVFGCTSM